MTEDSLMRRALPFLEVTALGSRTTGLLVGAGRPQPCALGRAGIAPGKREGDGITPAALLRPVVIFYRPDRERRPVSGLPASPIGPHDGWCDDPGHPAYNRPVTLPFPARHEHLWRADGVYDLVVVLDWNFEHPKKGAGSAIFMHIARPDLAPTEGCIALPRTALRRLLRRLGPTTRIRVRI